MTMIEDIYASIDSDADLLRLTQSLSTHLSSRSASFALWSSSGELAMTVSNRFPKAMLEYYGANRLYERDVWRASLLRRPADRVRDLDHDVHREDFLRSALKRELFDRFGDDTGRCLAFHSALAGAQLVVAVHRAAGEPAFEAECAVRLQALVAPLRRMFHLRERLGAAGSSAGLAADALDRLAQAVMMVSADGRIRYANSRALAILARDDGLGSRRGRLTASDSDASARLALALETAAARRGRAGDALLAHRAGDRAPYWVMVAPATAEGPAGTAAAGAAAAGGSGGAALVVVEDPDRAVDGVGETARLLFGLSRAEAELASLLMSGMTPLEAGSARGVSIATVRSQIKAILSKTGSRRTPEALGRLSRLSTIAPRATP